MNGINILAPFTKNTGYGVVACNLASALQNKVGVSLFPIGQIDLDPDIPLSSEENYSFQNPSLRIFHQFSMAEHVGVPRIGYPIFEKTNLNEREVHQLKSLDLVLSPTTWQSQILANHGINSKILPYGWISRSFPYIEPPKITTFLCMGKWELRKGQDFSVQCFNRAFTKSDDVRLIMHCDNPFLTRQQNSAWESMAKNSSLGSKIILSPRVDKFVDCVKLIQSVTCGLFLSRAEGWNLEASEMLALGRQIICTDYSGHTQFATYANSNLVRVGTERAVGQPELEGSDWARLDDKAMEQTIHFMRSVHKNNQYKNTSGINGGLYATWDRTADKLLEIISENK